MTFTFNTYTYEGATMNGTLTVPICELFETGKDYYTLKISAECSLGTDIWEYRVVSTNGYLPSIVLGGQAEASTPWGGLFYGTRGVLSATISSSSNWNTQYFTVTQHSHTGDNIFGSQRLPGNDLVGGGNITSGDIHVTIEADFPIFMGVPTRIGSDPDNIKYRPAQDNNLATYTGEISNNNNLTNIDKAINYFNVVNSIPTDITYFIRSTLKVNGTPTTTKGFCFQIIPGAKICLYQDNNITGDGSPNLHLIISQFPCLVKGYNDPDEDYAETSSPETEYWHSGYWRDINTGINYTGICSTNIPIFRGQENAQRYLDGELSESDALNGGNFANRNSSIGEELTTSDIPTISLSTSGIGSFAYALTAAQLTGIMENYLFTDDTTLQDTMKAALWTWGNNPIDFLIDCYYVPFSITLFYDTINTNLKFGSYQFPNTSYPAIKETNGDRLVLFDTTFEGVYGDWRDFTQFNYDLFLPFIGFVPLDVQKYLNRQVRCEMMFDLSTHNLRYYLFVDNKITDRFDGSVGINIPLMATDIVNKAKHDRDIKYGLVSDALSAGTQIGMGVTSADFGGMATGLVGGINTIVNGVKKYQELNNRASSSVNGSFSSSMNVYDISYAYLRITERQMILPSELNGVYNFPSYYIGTLNNLSGYCEIDDIQLKSNCTESEYNEIKTLLKGGVIF